MSRNFSITRGAGWVGAAISVVVTALFFLGCSNVPADGAATVNGVVITKDAVADRIRIAKGINPQKVPDDTDSEEYHNLQRDVTEQLVAEELEAQETTKRGITVEPAEIDIVMDQVIDDKYLGSPEKMLEDFNLRGLTEEDLRLEIRRQLLHRKLLESLRAEVPVTDEEIQAKYEENKSNYVYPEKRQTRQIVVGDQATANAVAGRLASGEDFAVLAGQVSIDPRTKQNGGLLGLVTKESLPAAVGNAAFSLEPNQISSPFKGDQGWYIVKVEFVAPASNITFDQVKDELKMYTSNQKVSERYKQYVEEVRSEYDIEYADDYAPREKPQGVTDEVAEPSLT